MTNTETIAQKLRDLLPEVYFQLMDKEDYELHYQIIQDLCKNKTDDKIINSKGDIEDFFIHKFSKITLKRILLKELGGVDGDMQMYRSYFNIKEGFILTSIYHNLETSERIRDFCLPNISQIENVFFDSRGRINESVIISRKSANSLKIQCINVSHNTLLSNLFETLEKQQVDLEFLEVWQIKNPKKGVDKYYVVDIVLKADLNEANYNSLKEDFDRYIQTIIRPLSIFDMVGPSMVGPSSSHTAGANRIGQISRNIILALIQRGEIIKNVSVKLLGSFRDTGVGHKTPSALGGGLCGFDTNHPDMLENGDPDLLRANGIDLGGYRTIFTGYFKGSVDEDKKYYNQKNSNIAEILVNTDKDSYNITGFSIGAGNVEIRFFNNQLSESITGKQDFYLLGNDIVSDNKGLELPIIRKIYSEENDIATPLLPFNTFEELLEYCEIEKKGIIDIICETEYILQKLTKDEIYIKMRELWLIMKDSVHQGVNESKKSMLGLSGGDAKKINAYYSANSLFDNIFGRSVSYATAVNEINAKSGVIVACPTAGSCGIVPGVLTAWAELNEYDEKMILESLMIAGFLGMILFTDVSTAGADYGCQAEIGAAAAMAASALVYLEKGNEKQMIEAFTIALKNSLGLICDPVAGLVEIPCVKRNGIYASMGVSAALMALSGVVSFVSPDEVVLTMREVGERLHADYKETGKAGLAKSRDGKRVEREFACEVNRFFKD